MNRMAILLLPIFIQMRFGAFQRNAIVEKIDE